MGDHDSLTFAAGLHLHSAQAALEELAKLPKAAIDQEWLAHILRLAESLQIRQRRAA